MKKFLAIILACLMAITLAVGVSAETTTETATENKEYSQNVTVNVTVDVTPNYVVEVSWDSLAFEFEIGREWQVGETGGSYQDTVTGGGTSAITVTNKSNFGVDVEIAYVDNTENDLDQNLTIEFTDIEDKLDPADASTSYDFVEANLTVSNKDLTVDNMPEDEIVLGTVEISIAKSQTSN